MKLDPTKLHQALQKEGVAKLYHANTVATSCTFLEQRGLLSRGAVERRGLDQTPQYSDDGDKQLGIWNDVWLDMVDIHERGRLRNDYGPVLFVFSLEMLLRQDLPEIWITRDNPIWWKANQDVTDRYFGSVEEFVDGYNYGDFFTTVTLRDAAEAVAFEDSLLAVIVDDPKREHDGHPLVDVAHQSLARAAQRGGTGSHLIRTRECRDGCGCRTTERRGKKQYADVTDADLARLFLPSPVTAPR